MPVSQHLSRVTVVLVLIATALLQFALDGRGVHDGPALLAVSVGGAVFVGMLARRRRWSDWNLGAVLSVLALALLPIVWDGAARVSTRFGNPYEVQLACVLRNAMLGLAATPRLPRATIQAAFASFFLVVFGFLWATDFWSIGLLVAYSAVGAWWLFAAYWEGLGGRFADSSERAVPVRPALAVIACLVLLALAAAPLASRSKATTALAGFFPSSGGTFWNDPYAQGGVGDGDQMVAAKDQASGFGPIDTDLFLESEMPSLYDSFSEFSEAEPVKKKRVRRAIPLAPSQMQSNHKRRGLTQQSTREFDTVRQNTAQTPETKDRLSAALLLVKGQTPLHLALETYDRWDGRSLIASSEQAPLETKLRNAEEGGLRWLDLSITLPSDCFTSSSRNQVRIVNLKTKRVPTPAGTRSVTLSRLHSGSMFTFADDGSLAMAVDHVPQLTIFEFEAGLRDRHSTLQMEQSAPEASDDAATLLAREWVRGVPAGWPQVEAVVARLRQDYTHDQTAMVPSDAEDSVEYFLSNSKRGPDFLFAASAAVMLRSLGYDTRVRSGFYANPDRFERNSDLTPVVAEDAHFWVEVRTSNGLRVTKGGEKLAGVWATVEPTPGYELLYAPETLLTRFRRTVVACLLLLAAYPIVSCSVLIVAGVALATRRRLFDATLVGWWSVLSRGAKADRLARLTLRLLQWRAWAHRQSRPIGTPLGKWETLYAHGDFVALASWALYGEGTPAPLRPQCARRACWDAIRTPLPRAGRPQEGQR
ncbi:MAG: transglutaminase-like domain-containing protein [Planctomycetota bacterium]